MPEPELDQMFPSLSPEEIDRLRRFGAIRRYAAPEPLFTAGDVTSGMFVVISGAVAARDGLSHVRPIVELGSGGFLAEAGMLPVSLGSSRLAPSATPRRWSSPGTSCGPC